MVDPRDQDQDRVFFGSTVTYRDSGGGERAVSIVGIEELDPGRGPRGMNSSKSSKFATRLFRNDPRENPC